MRTGMFFCAISGLLATACGNDSTYAGRGTQTLLVTAEIDYDEGGASANIRVRRAGVDVTDALVGISSDLGDVMLVYNADNHSYRGRQTGWKGAYSIQVRAGNDWLDGGIGSPEQPVLTKPAPGVAFDPHLADRGVVELVWSGRRGDMIRVRTKKYDPGFVPDQGSVLVSNTYFTEDAQDVSLERANSIDLAGGAPGSTLSAHIGSDARLLITNPF
jgi:hypothetical protein